ncbi:MAG: hypothetical protein AB202_02960 [Parcubacteria bacterium C7867-007]|nr:MAG: hypothetical protein AB202_02960 [Parcubacteria bacterium C7867-007]
MNSAIRAFAFPVLLSIGILVAIYIWGGWDAFFIATLLVVLEVTLSFDNAVVNARILAHMDEKWRKRFLTWGIIVAVFGTRFILPIIIVSASVGASPWFIAQLAAFNPDEYGHLLEGARNAISAFGGIFLLMVSLKYFFSAGKDTHWIRSIERVVAGWGKIEAIEIGISLIVLIILALLMPGDSAAVLLAGIVGIVLFIIIQGIANSFTKGAEMSIGAGSAALFVYLNILDAAFSLDGVVGAFALTNDILLIVIGLGIGAYFVRSLTVYLVRRNTLNALVYLEHGAHWAILALALAMLVSIFVEVPELITGSAGLIFVGAAYYSSLRFARKKTEV